MKTSAMGVARATLWLTAFTFIFLLSRSAYAHDLSDPNAPPVKTVRAIRVDSNAPKIDGVLDDDVWKTAPITGDFTLREPREHQGDPASEKTTAQFAYDDDALYVGIICYDSEPDKIIANLVRRDSWDDSDRIGFDIDTHHDHSTGYYFYAYASGSVGDIYNQSDDNNVQSWNGVWDCKVARGDYGWSVEMRIPYHVLRFSPKDDYTWGINLQRWIQRKKERNQWVLVPDGTSGWIPHYGHLVGISGIQPPKHLEFIPYTRGRSIFSPKNEVNTDGRDLSGAFGGDVRYGISSNISLNATINPDFGQVEADPAELNLTVFESFFNERRPFFVEGNPLFEAHWVNIVGISNPYQLFYSRRIGKRPGAFGTPDSSEEITRPDATTILGAARISGKTAGGTSFALMDAVTQTEYATVDLTTTNAFGQEQTDRQDVRIEPQTNYLVAKVQQDFLERSNIAASLTSVNRVDAPPSVSVGLDSHLKWKKDDYNLILRGAGSHTGSIDDRKNGYAAQAYFFKFSGWYGGQAYVDHLSDDFNVNDLGFNQRSGVTQAGAHVYAERQKPWLLARRSGYNINLWSRWNTDGVNLVKGFNLNNWNQLKFYGFAEWGLSHEFAAKDDLGTRGGPVMAKPGSWWGWFGVGSDDSKTVSVDADVRWGVGDEDSGSNINFGPGLKVRPSSNIQFSFQTGITKEHNNAQWVTNVDDDGDGDDDHYVFGELESRVADFTTRLNISFTPNLTLQGYLQPFVAVGNYGAIKELARPDSYEFTPYTKPLDFNPDFSNRSLRGNVVLRWEYQPGSALFLVWTQNRSAQPETTDPQFKLFRDAADTFGDDGENVFLVKLDYWLGM